MGIPAPDPLSMIGPSINATIKILEVTYQLKAVDEQTADLLSTTRHVDFMVQEARRLSRLKAGLLNTSERTMIDKVIGDTEDALRAVAKLVEPCRVDKDTRNSIKFGHRVMWVFRDNPTVRDKHQKLQVCHQSLTIVFTCLYSKDAVVLAPAPEGRSEEQPPPYDPQLRELRDWQNRRKGRKNFGETEGHKRENLLATSFDIPVAGRSSPCLLAIPLENDGRTHSFSTHSSEIPLETPSLHTPEVQTFVPCNSPPSLTTTSPKADNRSAHMNPHDSFPYDEDYSTLANTSNNLISPTPSLPHFDSSCFDTMLAPYTFNNDEKEVLQVEHRGPTHAKSPIWDRKSSSSATALDTAPSTFSSTPTLPSSTVATHTSSSFTPGDDFGSTWLESSRHISYNPHAPTDISSLVQHPLLARMNSDNQQRSTHQFDRLECTSNAEDSRTRESRAVTVSVGQGAVKRGGRSWLAYHATRTDTGKSMDWDG